MSHLDPLEPTREEAEAWSEEQHAALLQGYSDAFDKLCQERHEAGAKEYGAITFLGNDVVRMMMEELADTSNYCRMQFIKLMILQAALEEQLPDGHSVPFTPSQQATFEGFKGVGEAGWNKL